MSGGGDDPQASGPRGGGGRERLMQRGGRGCEGARGGGALSAAG